MTRTLSANETTMVIDALDAPGVDGYRLSLEYSGRAMYGDRCFGVIVDSVSSVFAMLAALGFQLGYDDAEDGIGEDVDVDLASDLARAARTDNMGYSTIVYFPGFELDSASVPEYSIAD